MAQVEMYTTMWCPYCARARALLEKKGRLTCAIIEGAAQLPCSMTYIERFGSLRRAYELIGYRPDTFKVYDSRRSAIAAVRGQIRESTFSAVTYSLHMHASPPSTRFFSSGLRFAPAPPSGSKL